MQNFAKLFDGFISTQAMSAGFVELQGERRIIDTMLGEALGYERPQDIRRVIRRKSSILQELGILPDGATTPDRAGVCREVLLNCAQATFVISCLCNTRSSPPIARNAYGWFRNIIKAANSGEFEPENAATTIFLQDIAEGLGMLGSENTSLQHEIELLCAEKAAPEWREPVDEDEQIKLCWNWRAYLDVGERQFIISILGETRLNRHQAADLWGSLSRSGTSPATWAGPRSGRVKALGQCRHCHSEKYPASGTAASFCARLDRFLLMSTSAKVGPRV